MKRLAIGAACAAGLVCTSALVASSSEPPASILGSAAGWSVQWGGVGDDVFNGVAVTSAGDYYVGGTSDPSPPAPPPMMGQPELDVLGGVDGVIAKYDKNGVQKWVRKFGTPATEEKTLVGATPSGDVYGAGTTTGTMLGQPTNAGLSDIFLVKFDKNGNQKWERQIGTASYETVTGISVNASGDAYISGYSEGNLGGQTNTGNQDAFLMKYDKNGNLKWTRLYGTLSVHWGWGVAATATDVVLVGYGETQTPTPLSSTGSGFAVKYDKNGNIKWETQIGTLEESDTASGVAITKTGDIYVSGTTGGEFTGEAVNNTDEAFLAKLTKNGALVWAHQMTRFSNVAKAPAVAKNGDVYLAAETGLALPGQHAFGDADVFVAKYTAAGALQWIRQFGTTAEDRLGGIVPVPSGGVAVAGFTGGIVWGHTNFGANDGFLALFPAT